VALKRGLEQPLNGTTCEARKVRPHDRF